MQQQHQKACTPAQQALYEGARLGDPSAKIPCTLVQRPAPPPAPCIFGGPCTEVEQVLYPLMGTGPVPQTISMVVEGSLWLAIVLMGALAGVKLARCCSGGGARRPNGRRADLVTL